MLLSHGHAILPSGHYLAYPRPVAADLQLSDQQQSNQHLPVTVIASEVAKIDGSWLAQELGKLENDDVFSVDFLSTVVFCCKTLSVSHHKTKC